jgi:nitric oxide dioxygenase
MTPEQLSLVQSSFRRLESSLPVMATRFYDGLFAKDPTLRTMFTIDMEEQKVRFTEKLTEIVRAISDLDALLTVTRALGVRHHGYGVRASHYPVVGAALLDAIASVLGDAFDPDTREAWALAYGLVAETMLEGATAARPIRD